MVMKLAKAVKIKFKNLEKDLKNWLQVILLFDGSKK